MDSDLHLNIDNPSRGSYPVSLCQGEMVLLAGQVNPHKEESVDAFVTLAITKAPGLSTKDLRQDLLQLALPGKSATCSEGTSPDYEATDNGLVWRKPTKEGSVPVLLTNFTAKIMADVVRDDGTEQECAITIKAGTRGKMTSTFSLPASKFASMNWPVECLGAEAIIYPGQASRDHARVAIQILSGTPIPRKTVYTHTGWRQVDGKFVGNVGSTQWVYLHGGGVIGPCGRIDDIEVDLFGALSNYVLPEPGNKTEHQKAIRATLEMLNLGEDPKVFPLWCGIWRAVLGSCDFGLYASGPTGVFKSEVAALIQQHWGSDLDSRHLPGSWNSTDNALEGLLFSAKDALVVVDDFAPHGGSNDVARWHQRADRVLRAQGNNAGRSRMKADGSLRAAKPPRGMVLSTGEDVPRGQSLRARCLIIEIAPGDINPNHLTDCQRDARSGLYAMAMAGFVQHLAGRYDQIQGHMRTEIEDLRQQAMSACSHKRTPEILAHLIWGLRHFLTYAVTVRAITETKAQELESRSWRALRIAAAQQSEHQHENEPTARFMELLRSAILSGHAHLASRDGKEPENAVAWGWRIQDTTGSSRDCERRPLGDRIGWKDGTSIYLDPTASYRVAQAMAGVSGDGLTCSAQTLRKRMAERGLLILDKSRDTLTVRRTLEGTVRNVLHLAGPILCVEPDKSDKSDINPILGGINPDKWQVPMSDSLIVATQNPTLKPDTDPLGGVKNEPGGQFVGNVGFLQQGTLAAENIGRLEI